MMWRMKLEGFSMSAMMAVCFAAKLQFYRQA
jgi:hypothetical protein